MSAERGAAFLDDLAAQEMGLESGKVFRLLTAADLASLPPIPWRVRPVLPAEGIGALFGPPGSGKSFLALELLGAIAEGREWFGHRVRPCPVVYVGLEGEAGVAQRAQAYAAQHGVIPNRMRVIIQAFDTRDRLDRLALVRDVKQAGLAGGVLCLDTLNRAAPGLDENNSAEMGRVIDTIKELQAELGGLVLVVHHSGKDASRGLRGHSSLLAALDVVLEVSRDGDRREWRLHKAKDGEDGKAHPFRLEVVEVGTDDDGEPITSCVVVEEEEAGEAVRRAKVPTGGNQRIVWDELGELLRAAGSATPKEAPEGIPPGRPAIRLEDAVEKLRDRLACDPKRKTERTREAFTGLVNRGLIILREGWLWCA
jgi:energy-coupling factor transporter ATP-binding protein EcfA2